jgi:hypothetical protein
VVLPHGYWTTPRSGDPFDGGLAVVPSGPWRADRPGRLPATGPLEIGPVTLGRGRPVTPRPLDGRSPAPSLWISDEPVSGVAGAWAALAERFPATGLWPLRLHSLYDGSGRPWNGGELEPVPEADVDAVDVQEALARGWRESLVPIRSPWPPGTGPLAPFGPDFPGLAPLQPAQFPAAFTAGPARLGLASCRRPADAVALAGWTGAINVTGAARVSAVLRSWEDRLGAVLVGLSFATVTLVVTRPPTADHDARRVAAEVAAFCPDALWQPEALAPSRPRRATLESMSRLLVRERVWHLWFD